jgi:preprotein translocase subunit SecE
MNAKTETGPGLLDTVKLTAAVLVLLAGVAAYYYFADETQLVRVLGLLAALVVGVLIGFQSTQGRLLWQFIQGSQVEIRKVVWPTQQETVQTTLIVMAFTIIMGLFFLFVDWVLLNVTQFLTGRGG